MVASAALPQPVLVIDDDPFVRTVVAAALDQAGLSVTCCASGREALMRVDELRPALVLVDYVMADMDGRAAWRALRARMAEAGLPAARGVFLTARNAADIGKLEPGIVGVIAKPFDPLTLVRKLQRVLMSPPQDAVPPGAARLAAVAEEFQRALPAAADHMDALRTSLRHDWQRDAADALRARVHALAGSAGLFGLHSLGAAASEAEGLLLTFLKREKAPSPAERDKLDAAVSLLVGHCRVA